MDLLQSMTIAESSIRPSLVVNLDALLTEEIG
jgi:hypothetical protein